MAPSSTLQDGRSALRGTIVTFGLRIISFLCNQIALRFLDPTTLGKANIQLELLLTSVLFLSREGFRLALTRNLSSENWNVAWLTIPMVTIIAGCALSWHLFLSNDPDYRIAGILYAISSWIEGIAEPAVIFFLRKMDISKRASAEALGTLVKAISTVVGLKYFGSQSVTAFGVAQMLYAVTYTTFLYSHAWRSMPKPTKSFDITTCSKVFTFTLQGVFKHVLTEADRIVLTTMSDNYDQGVYAMGSSYGGMAARILLQPLEENARLLLSRLAIRNATRDLQESFTILVKLVLYIGLVFSFIGVNYTNLLLNLMAGSKWGSNTEAAMVLSAFCVYTSFLAANGMTEAFVYGVTSSGVEIGVSHTITGALFAVCAPLLVAKYGTVGLVASNCFAMLIRIMCSMYFAAKYFGEKESKSPIGVLKKLIRQSSPHPLVALSFAIAWSLTKWTLQRLKQKGFDKSLQLTNKEWLLLTGQHVALGVLCMLLILRLAILLERKFVGGVKSMMVKPKND